MSSLNYSQQRVLSGMRPTGLLHLGHYHGVLKNWISLQHQYDCLFFVADWHALTTHYADAINIEQNARDMVIDWLAAGIHPGAAKIFYQSQVPEHAELHLLLSMITPLAWLERVPSFKDQQARLKDKELSTYGFLGYPLLQSADILAYRASLVPVGEDQVAHVELTREVARRFNYIYGKEPDFEQLAEAAIKKMGKKQARLYRQLKKDFQEQGDYEALEKARSLLQEQQNITHIDRERLFGYLEGIGKVILPEPESLLTKASKMPGLDGQKMSKSYGNTISLREKPEQISQKIRKMPTDPARVRRTDPGDPENCPVWQFHLVYSDDNTRNWVVDGCQQAKIGCLDCKQPVIDAVCQELEPMQQRAQEFTENPQLVNTILEEGREAAQDMARDTLIEVRQAIGIQYKK